MKTLCAAVAEKESAAASLLQTSLTIDQNVANAWSGLQVAGATPDAPALLEVERLYLDAELQSVFRLAPVVDSTFPLAEAGAAALLGFVASRFMVASASRRSTQAPTTGQYQPPVANNSYAAGTVSPSNTPSYNRQVGGNDAGI